MADSSIAFNSSSVQIYFCAATSTWCCGAVGDGSCCNGSSNSSFNMNNAQAISTAATVTATMTVSAGASSATTHQNTTGITSTPQCSHHDTAIGAGIGVGATVGTVIVVTSAWWMFRKRAKKAPSAQVSNMSSGYQHSSQFPNRDTAPGRDAQQYTKVSMLESTAPRVPELDTILPPRREV